MPLLMPLVLGVSIFDLVQFWAKINNQTDFFLLLNWTDNRFEPTMFGSVRFFPIPNQFKPKLFQ